MDMPTLILGYKFRDTPSWVLHQKLFGGGGEHEITTEKGNPITFSGHDLRSLKAFGATPVKHKAPALWGRYVPCDGTTNGSSTSIDTGVKAQDNIEMLVRFKAVTDSFYILQARETGSAKIYGLSGSQTGNTITSFGLTSAIKRTTGHICTVKMTMVNRAVTLYVKDETTGEEDTKTGTASASDYSFPSPTTIKLFGDASKIGSGVTVYRAYIKVNGEMKWDMYPAVDVDNSNAPVAYDDVAHNASTVVSGSITGGSLIQPIAYAESDGTAWADTGIIPTTFDYTITYEGAIKTLAGGPNCAWGYMGGAGNLPRWVCAGYSNNWLLNANTTSAIQGADTNNHTFVGKVYESGGVAKWSSEIDGVVKQNDQSFPSAETWAFNTLSIYLFARHNADGAGNLAPATLKRWICEKAGVVVRNYQPVRVGNTVELLDLVNWQFATRTGTFTAGADIPYSQLCPDIIKVNTGDLKYGVGKNLFDRPDGSYSSSDRGSVSVSNQVITVNYQWGSAWSIYKLSGAVNSNSIAVSITQMKSQAGTDVVFKAGKTYIVKLFDSTTDYYDLQISNTTTNMQISNGVAFTPTDDFNALWVRTQEGTQTAGNHTFKVMIVEGSTAPTAYEPYHFGLHTDGSHKLFIGSQGVVDLGTLSWSYSATLGCGRTFYASLPAKDDNRQVVCFCDGFTGITANSAYGAQMNTDKVCWIEDGRSIRFHDDIFNGNTTDFKSAMSGKYLFYQRTTDTEFISPVSRDIPMLLSADSFIDTQLDSNNKSEAWAVKVLDGVTAGLKFTSVRPLSTFYYSNVDQAGMTPSMSLICTHFENRNVVANGVCYAGNNAITFHHPFSTLEDANAWLASEYAKGTPVIVLYPLATPAVSTHAIAKVELTEKATYTVEGTAELPVTEQATYLGVGA